MSLFSVLFDLYVGMGLLNPIGSSMFNLLRYHQTVFHRGCTFYISNQQRNCVQFLSILTNACYFPIFEKIIAILIDVKWYLIVLLVFIP